MILTFYATNYTVINIIVLVFEKKKNYIQNLNIAFTVGVVIIQMPLYLKSIIQDRP